MLNVYDGLTELASDANGNPRGRWNRKQIADMACVSITVVIKAMKALQICGLIEEVINRDGKGYLRTPTILIRTHEEGFKLRKPDSINHNQAKVIPVNSFSPSLPGMEDPDSKSLNQGFGKQRLKNGLGSNKEAESQKKGSWRSRAHVQSPSQENRPGGLKRIGEMLRDVGLISKEIA